MILLFVGGFGLGLPNTYWHHLGDAQVLEGPDRVVLFIEVERAMWWPGFIGVAPHNHAAAFLRIDIFPDGRVERTTLRSDLEGHITLNTNLYAVVYLADGFYLVENPSYAPKPAYRLGPDRIDPLSPEDAIRATGRDVLHTSDSMFDLSRLDSISAGRGWRRLNHEPGGGQYLLLSDSIISTQHGVKLWHGGGWLREGAPEFLFAESTSSTVHWSRVLIEVDTRRWKSYRQPGDRAYLRERYEASPAR